MLNAFFLEKLVVRIVSKKCTMGKNMEPNEMLLTVLPFPRVLTMLFFIEFNTAFGRYKKLVSSLEWTSLVRF